MGKRVLVIDDEAHLRDVVTAYLEPVGYEVLSAETGEAGFLLANKDWPDIILLDLALPDMDGYEVCGLLRHGHGTRQVPVVMFTASNDPALTRRAYAAGAQACILKPFRREALIAVLQAVEAAIPEEKS